MITYHMFELSGPLISSSQIITIKQINAQKKSGFLYAKKCTNPSLVRLEFIGS